MARVEKTRNDNTLSERAFYGWIKGLLRLGSRRWRPINKVLKAGEDGKLINPATGRENKAYECAGCGGRFLKAKRKGTEGIQVDHIDPVVPEGKQILSCCNDSFDSSIHVCIGEVAMRMYKEVDGYQLLCKACNSAKSNKE